MSNRNKMGVVFVLGLILVALVMVFTARTSTSYPLESKLRNGDVIFQALNSAAGAAIRLATGSEFSHCGILYEKDGTWFVYEAIGPVQLTPLKAWIDQGENQMYEVKRLREAEEILTTATLKTMLDVGDGFAGKPYDQQFAWSDARMYCSELVWKIYKRGAGVTLGNLRPLKEYDLQHPTVRQALNERYGAEAPWDELMISPQGIYESPLLETVLRS